MNTRGNIISGIAATIVTAGIAIGAVTLISSVQSSDAAHARYAATDHLFDAEMAASATGDAKVTADAVLTQHIRDVNAQVQAAEDAKAAAALAAQQAAAAAAAAQQAAAQAAAQQQAQQTQTLQTSAATAPAAGSTSSGEPSGTPLPMMTVTDPNNAQYGQQVPAVDPGSWCAAHSASTINGVPTCD